MTVHSALLTDLYQLTMAQSYHAEGMHEQPASFSLFARKLPPGWGYLIAAGLDDVLRYLEGLRFTSDDLAALERTRIFSPAFLGHLECVRFRGSVRALREGRVFFAGEPVLEVDAPILEAQLAETMVLNEIHFQSLIAAKAARSVEVAQGRLLVDFSLRRTHRADAGMRVARSSYLAGFDATSNVLAGIEYGIPVSGTMAHSYIEAFLREEDAFRAFARSFPDRSTFLVDTYDSHEGLRRAARVGAELAAQGHRLDGVRLDSDDLAGLAREARAILDAHGLEDAMVFASGGLDERDVAELVGGGAPIGGFGIGTRMGTSADAPALDMAYKLVEFAGRPTFKLSTAKETLPGRKQVWRSVLDGVVSGDVLGLADERQEGEPLLEVVMEGGRRLLAEPLDAARERCAAERARLPAALRSLDATPLALRVSERLAELRAMAIELVRGENEPDIDGGGG